MRDFFPVFLATFPKNREFWVSFVKICSVFGILCMQNFVVFMRKNTKVQLPMTDLWIRSRTRARLVAVCRPS